jgi:hypothetical protein
MTLASLDWLSARCPEYLRGVAEVAGRIMEGFRSGEYPYLAEMAVDRAMKPGYNYGDEFEFGLDLILDGINRAMLRADSTSGAIGDRKSAD